MIYILTKQFWKEKWKQYICKHCWEEISNGYVERKNHTGDLIETCVIMYVLKCRKCGKEKYINF